MDWGLQSEAESEDLDADGGEVGPTCHPPNCDGDSVFVFYKIRGEKYSCPDFQQKVVKIITW